MAGEDEQTLIFGACTVPLFTALRMQQMMRSSLKQNLMDLLVDDSIPIL